MHRRLFLTLPSALGATALLQACGGGGDLPPEPPAPAPVPPQAQPQVCAPAMPGAPGVVSGLMPVPALRPGGTVAVLAPASPAAGRAQEVADWLAQRGFAARLYPSAYAGTGDPAQDDYLAASDAQRLQELHAAFADPGVHAIVCLRGGYGSARLLSQIDFALLRSHPKPFVGYSDITALHLALARHAGFVSFHGPMLTSDLLRNRQAPTEAALFAQLQGRQVAGSWLPHPPQFALHSLRCGAAQGRLVGGNLTLIGSTLGTPWEIDTQDAILFIEDVGEPPYKIDRLLTQLRLAGKLQGVRGVLIGDFSDVSAAGSSPAQVALDAARLQRLWQEFFVPLNVPVLAGWRSGHVDPNLTLPMGALVTLDADRQGVRVDQALVV
ncbi:S66 peptidase family protein [Diaphorobacter sp.]|uniref:S66 peptidase family protein n=1 Tax=Diaphorobacter sp. TaxID=1934310 RepID=UPI003D0EFEC1